MPDVQISGQPMRVPAGSTVLSALQNSGMFTLRQSLSGEPRGALCGMGICLECRVKVNGLLVRACLTPVAEGQCIELLTPLEPDHD